MNQFDPLERDLATWFAETALPRTPANFDDILRRTAGIRQRPRWTFPERLMPMTATTSFRAATSGAPWRTAGLLALLLLALVAGVLLAVGSHPPLPAPFGLAATGLVAYSADGDIYVVDRSNGTPRALVSGSEDDVNPQWSRDGTRLVFKRTGTTAKQSLLFVMNADGSGLTQVTPSELVIDRDVTGSDFQFSPDGSEVAFISAGRLVVGFADGSGLRDLGWPLADAQLVTEIAYRPSDGSQMALVTDEQAIWMANLETGALEPLSAATSGYRRHPVWSPDGRSLAYHEWHDATVFTVRARVLNVETGVDRLVDPAADVFWDGLPVWSNDGQRFALLRGYADGYDDVTAAIVAADGSGLLGETPHGLYLLEECCAVFEWAPDDRWILFSRADLSGRFTDQVLIDPATGVVSDAPWPATSDPSWQRLAP